jgi:8-oxo-dGTP diphosphatase
LTEPVNHAVKALIYRNDGRILLQQRDYASGLPFPGFWTFFGGLVEQGENLRNALERELREELGCVPGQVGEELFCWEWHGAGAAHNHVFPVQCQVGDEALVLGEGLAMRWLSLEDLKTVPAVPGLIENLAKIEEFLVSTHDCKPNSSNND